MPRFPHSIVTLVAAAALFGSSACAAPPISYPDALTAAAVSESKISDIRSPGLVVGNGELNAIVYSSADNDLHPRISKNDCWDMRIDTQDDPPLPLVDAAAGTMVGHGDHRQPAGERQGVPVRIVNVATGDRLVDRIAPSEEDGDVFQAALRSGDGAGLAAKPVRDESDAAGMASTGPEIAPYL